jgi:hypothetical protein
MPDPTFPPDPYGSAKAKRAANAADELVVAVNELSFDVEAFAAAVRASHRTSQQAVMRAIVALLQQWADDAESGNFDLRNEDSVRLAKRIQDAVGVAPLAYI